MQEWWDLQSIPNVLLSEDLSEDPEEIFFKFHFAWDVCAEVGTTALLLINQHTQLDYGDFQRNLTRPNRITSDF